MFKLIPSFLLILLTSITSFAQTFYIAPGGKGNGSKQNPFGTLQEALAAVKRVNHQMKSDVEIVLRGGVYAISEPIKIGPELSGQNGFNVVFKAFPGEVPVISGGVKVSGWQKVSENIFKAQLNSDEKLRALFVNGKRCRMAGTEIPVAGLGNWGEFEVKGDEPWAYGPGKGIDGILFSAKDLAKYGNAQDLELVQFNIWTEKILCARAIDCSSDTCIVKLQQPYGAIATNMAWAGKINYNKAFVIRNAKELLDSPGEFYFDRQTKELFYYSDGEDMATSEVFAPVSDGLIQIYGKDLNHQVKNIRFEGITFSHDDWQLMEVAGSHAFAGIQSLGLAVKFVPGGNWHPTKYNSTDVPTGTIDVQNASNISFVRNRFERNGSAIGINLLNDVQNATVEGNVFHDLLGNAVNIGHPHHYEIGDDGDRFENDREAACSYIRVANNYLRNICLDYRQVEGITGFFAHHVTITHNDIRSTPYGAIAFGWWWGNADIPPSQVAHHNEISYNRAGDSHLVLDDGGIIYVLGEQPESEMHSNYVFNGPRCLYPDDGSAFWTIRDNVVENPSYKHMWLHLWTKRCHDVTAYRNYVKNNLYMDNGTNNLVEQTYSFREDEFSTSSAAQKIMDESGLQQAFKNIIPASDPERIFIHPKSFKETDRFH